MWDHSKLVLVSTTSAMSMTIKGPAHDGHRRTSNIPYSSPYSQDTSSTSKSSQFSYARTSFFLRFASADGSSPFCSGDGPGFLANASHSRISVWRSRRACQHACRQASTSSTHLQVVVLDDVAAVIIEDLLARKAGLIGRSHLAGQVSRQHRQRSLVVRRRKPNHSSRDQRGEARYIGFVRYSPTLCY